MLDAATKWQNFGLSLHVHTNTLERIAHQFDDQRDQLRETLKDWLKNATEPTWQDIVKALKNRTVEHAYLAKKIEDKYCLTSETAQVSRPATQQELQTKNQELQKQNRKLVQQVQHQQQTINYKDKQLQALEEEVRKLQADNDHLKRQKKLDARERQSQEHNQKMKKVAPQAQQDDNWVKCIAPEEMFRGSAACDGSMAYFNNYNSNVVHEYNSKKQSWKRLPELPCTFPTLVIVQSMLTMVGGKIEKKATNTLFSLVEEGREKKWLPSFCKMPSKRWLSAALFSGESLIVAGGCNDQVILRTVEVLNTNTQHWSIAGSMQQPLHYATMTICGNNLYLLGGWKEMNERTHEVFTCSIHELLQSCTPLAGTVAGNISANKSTVWHRVDNAPYYDSTCATLGGQLISVGGMDKDGRETPNISIYDEKSNSWKTSSSSMLTARRLALVAILNDKIMIVGGWSGGRHSGQKLDTVEKEAGI